MKLTFIKVILLLVATFISFISSAKAPLPNIVIIYADDMGYGDLNIQNANSKFPTPNLEQLAREGMRFTDAHSSSGICSPSRYSLLTGRYHWRRQHAIVHSFGEPFFAKDDITLPQILQNAGYTTAAIGKWHPGWHWPFNNKPSGKRQKKKGIERFIYLKILTGLNRSPADHLNKGLTITLAMQVTQVYRHLSLALN